MTGGIIDGVRRASKESWRRTRKFGAHAGWICLRAHAQNYLVRIRNRYGNQHRVTCPCCNWHGNSFRVLDAGHWIIPQVECPNCGAHDRHRMFSLFLTRLAPIAFDGKNAPILHFAPDKHICLQGEKSAGDRTIIAADIQLAGMASTNGRRVLSDVQHIGIRSDSLDAIICIHLLEHVENDALALHEFFRVLKPGGAAYVMVPFAPIAASRELDRPDPLLFGHVREYSQQDFAERLHEFDVECILPLTIMTPEEQCLFQIPDHQVVFICRKAVPNWPSSGK